MSLAPTLIRTFQTRLRLDEGGNVEAGLAETARVFGTAQRALHAESGKTGKSLQSFKTGFCARFGMAARMFNAVAIDLQGKLDGVREKALHDLEQLAPRIEAQRALVEKLREQAAAPPRAPGVLRRSPEQIRAALEKANKRLVKPGQVAAPGAAGTRAVRGGTSGDLLRIQGIVCGAEPLGRERLRQPRRVAGGLAARPRRAVPGRGIRRRGRG